MGRSELAQQHPTAVPDGLALDREPQPGTGLPAENGAAEAVTRPYDAGLPPEPTVEPLLQRVRQRNPRADTAAVGRAFELARERHAGRRRASGVPYLAHPLGVATVVAVAVPVQPPGLNTSGAHSAMARASARPSAWIPSSRRAA